MADDAPPSQTSLPPFGHVPSILPLWRLLLNSLPRRGQYANADLLQHAVVLVRTALRAAELGYYHAVLGPRGWGLPVSAANSDAQYRSGHWSIFRSLDEMGRYALLAAYIKRMRAPAAVLDVGCGNGELIAHLVGVPLLRFVGVDASETAIAAARELRYPGATFHATDIERWLPSESFDAIVFNESLYYLRRPDIVMRRYSKVLTADGAMLVSMFRHRNTPVIWKKLMQDFVCLHAMVMRNRQREVFDIRLLRPRSHQ